MRNPIARRAAQVTFRQRIMFVTALSAFVTVLLFATVTYFALQRSLLAALDERLHNDYELVSVSLHWRDGVLTQREAQHAHVDGDQESAPSVEVRDSDGILVLLESAPENAQPGTNMPPFNKQPGYRTQSLPNGHSVRTVVKPMMLDGVRVWVRITRGVDRVSDDLWRLLQTFLALTPVVGLLCLMLGWWGAHALVRPVQALEAAMKGINARQLNNRVPVSAANDELTRLAQQFNAMLSRLEDSFISLEQFSADVAHEIRTPLMAIQVGAENALARSEPSVWKNGLHEGLEHVGRLALLVDRLLLLARADRNTLPLSLSVNDVPTLLLRVQSLMQPLLDAADTVLVIKPQAATIACDEALVTQVLIDLVDNAMRYGAGPITLSCDTLYDAGQTTCTFIEVSDYGAGIKPIERARALARFGRLDSARSEDTEASSGSAAGLGLAIAQSIMLAHGGLLTLLNNEPRGLTVRLAWLHKAGMSGQE